MSQIYFIFSFGLLSTFALSFFLAMVRQLKICDVNLVQTVGSFLTRSSHTFSSFVGWFFHLIFGVFFAFLYIFVMKAIPEVATYNLSYLFAGIALGFVHGIIFSFLLLVLVTEHHPVKKYRELGFKAAIFYFLGHVLYGLGIGFFYMFMVSFS